MNHLFVFYITFPVCILIKLTYFIWLGTWIDMSLVWAVPPYLLNLINIIILIKNLSNKRLLSSMLKILFRPKEPLF